MSVKIFYSTHLDPSHKHREQSAEGQTKIEAKSETEKSMT